MNEIKPVYAEFEEDGDGEFFPAVGEFTVAAWGLCDSPGRHPVGLNVTIRDEATGAAYHVGFSIDDLIVALARGITMTRAYEAARS